MFNLEKNFKLVFSSFIVLLLPLIFMPALNIGSAVDYINFELKDKSTMFISLNAVDPRIHTISDDPGNQLVMKLEIKDENGYPVPGAGFQISSTDRGSFISPARGRTDKDGSCLVTYSPSRQPSSFYLNGKSEVTLTGRISNTTISSALKFQLMHVPVIFLHGYKAPPSIFDSFASYLQSKGFNTISLNFDSDKGVAFGAAQLSELLEKEKVGFLEEGILIKRFDLIGHSMGGLVARYYTGSREYLLRNDVQKMIFVSVPHNGSSLASLGLKYYSDRGIFDLIPDSDLFVNALPAMKNKGLNETIQVGNILGQYDEVVSAESASLHEWGIRTELFNVGDNNFTVDKLISGKIVEAANHKAVLYNRKIFKRVEEMLSTNLPYPSKK